MKAGGGCPSYRHYETFCLSESSLVPVEGEELRDPQIERGGNVKYVSQTMSR